MTLVFPTLPLPPMERMTRFSAIGAGGEVFAIAISLIFVVVIQSTPNPSKSPKSDGYISPYTRESSRYNSCNFGIALILANAFFRRSHSSAENPSVIPSRIPRK